MATYLIHQRAWTRAEYDELIARGSFRPDERLELLGGQLVVREPQAAVTRYPSSSRCAPFSGPSGQRGAFGCSSR